MLLSKKCKFKKKNMLSKVILQANIDKVETYFDRADKVVIVTHVSPDGMPWVLRWACIIFCLCMARQ